jgi:hypothetical protein
MCATIVELSSRNGWRFNMERNDNPTGAQMLARQLRVRDMVLEALREYPQGRGDDALLYLYILRKHYWRLVQVRMKDGVSIKTRTFNDFLMLPSWETCRRRRQELVSKYPDLRPSVRVQHKRARLQDAMRHDLGNGQYTIGDFEG